MQYQSITELIDSGDEKFKLGLAWYIIHRYVGNRSDYHYIDLLKLSTEEIKRILDERYNYFLITGSDVDDLSSIDTRNDIKTIIKRLRLTIDCGNYTPDYSSPSMLIGDFMYRVLIEPDKYFTDKKPTRLGDRIGRAANRVIRNYQTGGLLYWDPSNQSPDACMHYVQSYHKAKGFKRTTGW